MNIQHHIYTYQDAINGVRVPNAPSEFDCLDANRLKAFLSNPNLTDMNIPMLVYTTVDDDLAGWLMLFPTKLLLDGNTCEAMSASDFFVLEKYQHLAIGLDLALFPIEGNKYLLYAGSSPKALKIYRKLRFNVFYMPYIERKQKFAFKGGRGLEARGRDLVVSIANLGLTFSHRWERLVSKGKGYEVKQHDEVPAWVDQVIQEDACRFCEIHDRQWLQWSLVNRYHGEEENKQSFFGIYKDGEPQGFALTTERLRFGRVYGFVAEWGSKDCQLTEELIYRLIIPTFSKKVERIGLALNDERIAKSFKKIGFRRGTDYNIVFLDQIHQVDGVQKADNWRLRYGYADVIMSC